MSLSGIVIFGIFLLIMLVGMVGVIIPILPGVPLIFGATFVYALITDFNEITWNVIGIFVILTAVSLVVDWLATTYGVKKMGGSYAGMIGAFLGMIIGLFAGAVFGLVIGAFIGAIIGELLVGKKSDAAVKAGVGSFLGLLAGGLLKFIIGVVMIGVFVWKIVF